MLKFFFNKKLLIINYFLFFNIEAIKITRAIMSWDGNPKFDNFWPIVSKAWSELIDVRPTLIFLGPKNKKIDTRYGDIKYIEPIKNISLPFQAMAIRPLAAALFPDDICIISDLDMIPINKDYFEQAVQDFKDNSFIVFYPKAYKTEFDRYMMCYNVAKGSTFGKIFEIKNESDIKNILTNWFKYFFPIFQFKTDEKILYRYLNNWKFKKHRLKLLNLKSKRLNREKWQYNSKNIMKYIDAHLLRPYCLYKKEIEELVSLLNLSEHTAMH